MSPLAFLENVLSRVVAARETGDEYERAAILEALELDLAAEIQRTPVRYRLDDFNSIPAGPDEVPR